MITPDVPEEAPIYGLLADGLRLFVMTGALAGRFDVAAAARYPEALYYTEG